MHINAAACGLVSISTVQYDGFALTHTYTNIGTYGYTQFSVRRMQGYETVFGIYASNPFKIIAHSKCSPHKKRGDQIINL